MEYVKATRKEPSSSLEKALDDCQHGGDSRHVVLNNEVKCPVVGIGTFMLSPAEAENSVREALKMGYSLVDTANAYVNERACGRGMKVVAYNMGAGYKDRVRNLISIAMKASAGIMVVGTALYETIPALLLRGET